MKKLCIFCGSSLGFENKFNGMVEELAENLVNNNIDLVYGGVSIGIMGALADKVLALGGRVYGVVPKFILNFATVHENLTELIYTETMHERKQKMHQLSDGFLTIPGGIGTLEEFFEAFTWAQLNIHKKPCFLFNYNNFYSHLIEHLKIIVKNEFMTPEILDLLKISDSITMLNDQLRNYIK